MKKNLLLIALLSGATLVQAQEQKSCDFNQLSKEFDISLTPQTVVNKSDNVRYLSKITCTVNQKDGRLMQIITVKPGRTVDFKCAAQSFVTDYNTDGGKATGTVIVADFNFDGLDDVAVLRDLGSTQSYYDYYIQSKEGRFNKSNALSNELPGFPEVNARMKTLTVYRPIDTRLAMATIYHYDAAKDQLVKVREYRTSAHHR